MQQRLIPHTYYYYRWIENGEGGKYHLEDNESEMNKPLAEYFDAVHMFGKLYRKQEKLDEAEEIDKRALEGYEKAFGLENAAAMDRR